MKKIINHRSNGEVPMTGLLNHNVMSGIPMMKEVDGRLVHAEDLMDEGCSDETAKQIGLFPYIARSLSVSEPGDIIQLHPSIKSSFAWILEHYQRIGLAHALADDVIWDDDFKIMGGFADRPHSVFFFGKRAHSVKPDQSWRDIVRKMNSKNEFIRVAQSLGIRTPKTYCFADKKIADLSDINFPCFLKIDVSTSGLGVEKCNNLDELESLISAQVMDGVSFQVQESIENAVSVTVLYRIENGKLERWGVNEAILKGFSHDGNISPTVHQPWNITDQLAGWMHRQGMKGHFGFNLMAKMNGGPSYNYWAIECNPRYNGSSYPTTIAQKLSISFWKAVNCQTALRSFEGLDLGELEYCPKTKRGVVIVNWGVIDRGKIGLMFAGKPAEIIALEEKTKILLA